ncbi:MAG: RNA-binding protein [Bacteroidales bacterium]|nr:RNA-binding protein [Bacteroidales bacterium]
MNIYVGNLNYKVRENDLNEVFSEFGEVHSVKIITDKYTGKSKGFGFVVMEDDSEARNAINNLNGRLLEDRELIVNEARPKKEGFFRQ